MQKTNKSLIYGLIALVLLMATGYAIFSQTLRISGTANTKGTFALEFSSATATGTVGCTPTAVISADKSNLAISVSDLAYPGAGTQIDVVVKNTGTIPALLKNVNITGNTDPDVTVDTQNVPTNVTLQAGESRTFSIVVRWAQNSTNATNKDLTFSVDLAYEQNTTSFGQ